MKRFEHTIDQAIAYQQFFKKDFMKSLPDIVDVKVGKNHDETDFALHVIAVSDISEFLPHKFKGIEVILQQKVDTSA